MCVSFTNPTDRLVAKLFDLARNISVCTELGGDVGGSGGVEIGARV